MDVRVSNGYVPVGQYVIWMYMYYYMMKRYVFKGFIDIKHSVNDNSRPVSLRN